MSASTGTYTSFTRSLTSTRTVSSRRRMLLRRAAIILRRAIASLFGRALRSGSEAMIAANAVANAVAADRAMTAQCLTISNSRAVKSSTGVRLQAAATRNIGFTALASATLRLASATAWSLARMSGAGLTLSKRASAAATWALALFNSSAWAFWAAALARTASAWTAAPQFHDAPCLPAHVRPGGGACSSTGLSISARCFCAASTLAARREICSAYRLSAEFNWSRLILAVLKSRSASATGRARWKGDDYRSGGPRLVHSGGRLDGPPPGGPLQPPAGGGGGDTEARLRVLETHVGYIREQLTRIETTTNSTKDDLSGLKIETARLSVKVDHLPSKGFIVSVTMGGLALLGALIFALGKVGLLAQTIK